MIDTKYAKIRYGGRVHRIRPDWNSLDYVVECTEKHVQQINPADPTPINRCPACFRGEVKHHGFTYH